MSTFSQHVLISELSKNMEPELSSDQSEPSDDGDEIYPDGLKCVKNCPYCKDGKRFSCAHTLATKMNLSIVKVWNAN
jgi:hypothetical protein